MPPPPTSDQGPRPWAEVALLLSFAAVNLFLRVGELPFHGEESRRVQIAREMVQTGDWLVPRLQGVGQLTKPPLHYWILGGTMQALGSADPWAMRLPSSLATLLTALLVWWYAGRFLSRFGAFAAAFTFLTMGEILRSGSDAEMDAVFTLFLAASLLLWHGGMLRGWPPALYWTAGYGFAALAMLTKGVQGPVYFVGGVLVYLLLTRRAREVWHRGHLLGAVVFVALVGAWLLPYCALKGPESARTIFFREAVGRSLAGVVPFARHLVVFPLELFATLLPWSMLLLVYLRRPARRWLADRPEALFAVVAFAVAFPTCWLPPGGETRYLRPLVPCLAVLIGLALQRIAEGEVMAGWRRLLGVWAVVGGGVVAAVAAVTWLPVPPALRDWQQPGLFAAGFIVMGSLAVAGLGWARAGAGERRVTAALVLTAAMLSATITGVVHNRAVRRLPAAAGAIAAFRKQLPPGATLESFGPVHHLFLVLYGEPIPCRDWPRDAADPAGRVDYFCFEVHRGLRRTVPFAWEEVAVVSMDRTQRTPPDTSIVIGRRYAGRTMTRR